jgi:hypothetical protein
MNMVALHVSMTGRLRDRGCHITKTGHSERVLRVLVGQELDACVMTTVVFLLLRFL